MSSAKKDKEVQKLRDELKEKHNLDLGDDGGGWEAAQEFDEAMNEEKSIQFWQKNNPNYHDILSRVKAEAATRADENESKPVSVRLTDNEIAQIDAIAKQAQTSTGIATSRSWVIRELLKIGAESLIKRIKG